MTKFCFFAAVNGGNGVVKNKMLKVVKVSQEIFFLYKFIKEMCIPKITLIG